jgi:hypothetical protein
LIRTPLMVPHILEVVDPAHCFRPKLVPMSAAEKMDSCAPFERLSTLLVGSRSVPIGYLTFENIEDLLSRTSFRSSKTEQELLLPPMVLKCVGSADKIDACGLHGFVNVVFELVRHERFTAGMATRSWALQ